MGSSWPSHGSWTPHAGQVCTHLPRPPSGSTAGDPGRNVGPSASCSDLGEGRPGRRGRGSCLPRLGPCTAFACGHCPAVSCVADTRGWTGTASPPGACTCPHPQRGHSCRGGHLRGEWQTGKGLFLSSLFFVFFHCQSKKKKKKKKKERKKLLRDSFELFAKSAFYHHTEKAPLPAPGEQISSSFSGPARLQLSPRPRDRPGHRRGEKLLVLLVHQAALPYLPLDPPCWLGWGFEKMGGTSGSLCQSRGWGAVCVGGEAVMGCPGYPGLSLGQSPPARQTPQVGLTPSSHLSPAGGNCQLLC